MFAQRRPGLAVSTCIEFSCRLRYRVLTDMLSGTCSRFCLVQMTRLAWLEHVQREGQVEAAPANCGPWRMRRSRRSRWTNRKRKGEGPGRQVSVAMRMATGTWPCSLIRRYRWGGSTSVDLWFTFPSVRRYQFVPSNSTSSEISFVLCQSLFSPLVSWTLKYADKQMLLFCFFPWAVRRFEWGVLWSEKSPGVTAMSKTKRKRERSRY